MSRVPRPTRDKHTRIGGNTQTVFPADKLDLYANGEGSAGKTGRYVYFILEKESEHTANKKVRKRISFAPF